MNENEKHEDVQHFDTERKKRMESVEQKKNEMKLKNNTTQNNKHW